MLGWSEEREGRAGTRSDKGDTPFLYLIAGEKWSESQRAAEGQWVRGGGRGMRRREGGEGSPPLEILLRGYTGEDPSAQWLLNCAYIKICLQFICHCVM